MQQFITDRLPQIEDLCRTYQVRRMSIFGSAVRDDFNPDTSDVDVRVEFMPDVKPAHTWGTLHLKDALRAIFEREVDLLYRPVRNNYLRREIEGSEVTIYEA